MNDAGIFFSFFFSFFFWTRGGKKRSVKWRSLGVGGFDLGLLLVASAGNWGGFFLFFFGGGSVRVRYCIAGHGIK